MEEANLIVTLGWIRWEVINSLEIKVFQLHQETVLILKLIYVHIMYYNNLNIIINLIQKINNSLIL